MAGSFIRKNFFFLVLLICILFSSDFAFAQRNGRLGGSATTFRGNLKRFPIKKQYYSIGVTVNALNYFGDMAPKSGITSTDISFTKPGFGIVASRRYGPGFTMRASFTYGRLQGDDFNSADPMDENARYRYVRNLHFRNDIKELAVTAVMDLVPNHRTYFSRVNFTPYAFAGFAVLHHNPKAMVPNDFEGAEARKWVALAPLGTEGQHIDGAGVDTYKKFQIAIPLGIGVRYKLTQNFDLSFEIGYRHLFFDYIDDVSSKYIDLNRFDNELARAMADRSLEATAPVVKEERNFEAIGSTATLFEYDSPYGPAYQSFRGYGHENANGSPNIRGNKNDNDIYFITSFQLTYVFDAKFRNGKFR